MWIDTVRYTYRGHALKCDHNSLDLVLVLYQIEPTVAWRDIIDLIIVMRASPTSVDSGNVCEVNMAFWEQKSAQTEW